MDEIPIKPGTTNEVDLDELIRRGDEAQKIKLENRKKLLEAKKMEQKQMEMDTSEADEEDYEEFDDIPESPPLAEQVEIKRPQDIQKPNPEVDKYEAVLGQNPELRNYIEYMWLKQKVASGQPLTPEEQQLKNDYDLLAAKETLANKEAEEKAIREAERQSKLQKEILMEYAETKQKAPQKIVTVRESDVTLSGGTSIPKLMKFILTLNKAKKKGGKVLVQVFRSRKVLVKWTASDITFVEFYTTDEKGNELMEVTRFSEYPYSFEGTPIPVLFAVQGYAEGFDFFSEFRKDLSSEMVSRLITRAFHAGYLKGAEVAQPNKKNGMLEGLMAFTPIILIGGFAIMGYLLYTMYNDNTMMLKSMEQMQATLAARFPQDVNALVVR